MPATLTIIGGSELRLTCVADGFGITWEWYFESALVEESQGYTINNTESWDRATTVLIHPAVDVSNQGAYSCVALNSAGAVYSPIKGWHTRGYKFKSQQISLVPNFNALQFAFELSQANPDFNANYGCWVPPEDTWYVAEYLCDFFGFVHELFFRGHKTNRLCKFIRGC